MVVRLSIDRLFMSMALKKERRTTHPNTRPTEHAASAKTLFNKDQFKARRRPEHMVLHQVKWRYEAPLLFIKSRGTTNTLGAISIYFR